MPLTLDEKQKAKDDLRLALMQLDQDTLLYWLSLFRGDAMLRKHSGYSKGADDMLARLLAAYESKRKKLMAPFDRGDYD